MEGTASHVHPRQIRTGMSSERGEISQRLKSRMSLNSTDVSALGAVRSVVPGSGPLTLFAPPDLQSSGGQPLTFPLFCVCSWAVGIRWGPGMWAEARGCLSNVRGSERATKVACNSCTPFPELCGVEGLPGNGWMQKWPASPPHSGAIFQPDVASESGFLYRKGAS